MSKFSVFLIYVCVMLGVIGHATSEFIAVLSGLFGPELSVWRFILGGLGLVVVSLIYRPSRDLITPLRRDGLKILLLAVFGMSFAQLMFHWGLNYASIVQVATMVTSMPILVVGADYLVNRAPVTAPKLVSGLGAMVGIAFLLTDGYLEELRGAGGALFGVLLAFGCAVFGAFYMVLAKPLINQYGAIRMMTYTFALGAVALFLVVGLVWGIWVDPTTLFDRPPKEYAAILTLGWWNTTIAMVLWLGGLAAAPDLSRANYLFFLKPVIAAGLALAILGQPVSVIQVLAIVAICGCVLSEVFWDQIKAFVRRQPATDQAAE